MKQKCTNARKVRQYQQSIQVTYFGSLCVQHILPQNEFFSVAPALTVSLLRDQKRNCRTPTLQKRIADLGYLLGADEGLHPLQHHCRGQLERGAVAGHMQRESSVLGDPAACSAARLLAAQRARQDCRAVEL